MASNISASKSPSWERTKNVPRLYPTPGDNPTMCHDNSNSFFIDFCNICGLCSNFNSVENHFSFSKPYYFFSHWNLSFWATDSNLYFVPFYFLYYKFHSKAELDVVYVYPVTSLAFMATKWIPLNSQSSAWK